MGSSGRLITSADIADLSIVNADVATAAGIVTSKLAAGGTANRVVATADGTTTALQQIVNAMVSPAAALDPLKLAADAYCALSDQNNQAIANNTVTGLTWAVEVADTLGMHAAASSDVVIPTGYGGLYLAVFVGAWAAGGTGTRQLQVYVGGAPLGANADAPLASVAFTTVIALFYAGAGTIVKVIAYQDSGGSVNFLGTAGGGSTLRVARIGT